MSRIAAICAISFFVLSSVYYTSTTLRPTTNSKPIGDVDPRVQRLIRHNERLQRALAAAKARIARPNPTPPPTPNQSQDQSKYAYVFYATSDTDACSVLINVDRLRYFQSGLPVHVLISGGVGKSFTEALERAEVEIHYPQQLADKGGGYRKNRPLKFHAFRMHKLAPDLERVLVLDPDQLIMEDLDPLAGGLPQIDLVAPRAYWRGRDILASSFLVIQLSDRLLKVVESSLRNVHEGNLDMSLINKVFRDTSMVLSGEYATQNGHWEDWTLPNWFHPSQKINMTTVELVNSLSNSRIRPERRTSEEVDKEGSSNANDREHPDGGSTLLPSEIAAMSLDGAKPETEVDSIDFGDKGNTTRGRIVASQEPRFPANHPITTELYRLYETAPIVQFSALSKPWARTVLWPPDAHPVFAEQVETWREAAKRVCPGGIPLEIG